ncbi:MAG: hypothetical protein C7B46_20355 [Sulfobacillus benefaciens]|uniref:Uncharacterized protein n=1 Tax=Sulfobacillus benefaciens TaxID=453960 RepID=A0A2T2WUX9_9FIRM|nr:MAG: hypothetical protein C7B46_20355 [Sulfobacillus benefaciens]
MTHQNIPWRRAYFAGILGTLVFSVLLHFAPMVGSPRLNLPLWGGTLITLNLGAATLVGYGLEFGIGVLLARLYQSWAPRIKSSPVGRGALYGLLLWAVLMLFGLPLFGMLSPLVSHGLMLSPGIFAWHYGLSTALLFMVSLLMYGISVGYLIDTPVLKRLAG